MVVFRDNKEEYLTALTRENTQLLVNAIWELPTERVDESIVAKLPEPTTVLPRLRKPPGPRPLTKWEKFAKEKGISKKKKDKKTYDETMDASLTPLNLRVTQTNPLNLYRNGFPHMVSSVPRPRRPRIGCLRSHRTPIPIRTCSRRRSTCATRRWPRTRSSA